jgi:Flp pilus assembly protein CpaB
MTLRLRNIVLASVLALVAGALTLTSIARSHHQAAGTQVAAGPLVYVATRDIPTGTPSSDLLAHHFVKQVRVASGAVADGAIQSADALAGTSVVQTIYAGEQLTTRRVAPLAASGVVSRIAGAERGFQLAGNASQLLAGTLKEGDHVDVVASFSYPEGASTHVVRVVASDVEVLRAPAVDSGQTLAVVLAPTVAQARRIYYATVNATWSLMVRPYRAARNGDDGTASAAALFHTRAPAGGGER